MSKIKKKVIERPSSISEDIKLIKMVQFAGWIFLLAFVGYFGVWVSLDMALGLINVERDEITFAYLVFTGTSAAFCFGLSSKISNNRERKKEFFLDWLVGEFLFCMFAIITLSAYKW